MFNRRHILDLDDFNLQEIELILNTTELMKKVLKREINKVPLLRGKLVANLFYEPSTRTRVSFEIAAKNLGADVTNITATESSVVKGESLTNTVRTLEALGVDVIVMRSQYSGTPYLAAQHFKGCLINAGDGRHAHPTQALLDIYTIREKRGKVAGLKVLILGDILHSRVARSNIWGLSTMRAKVTLCGPPTLIKKLEYWHGFPPVIVEYCLDKAIIDADVVMTLRLQKERQESGLLPSLREYIKLWQLNKDRLAKAKPNALIMHPGPINEGVEIAYDVAHGTQSVIEEQVTNGVAIRMALLKMLCS